MTAPVFTGEDIFSGLGWIVSAVVLLFAILTYVLNRRNANNSATQAIVDKAASDSEKLTRIDSTLENVKTDTTEIKIELRDVKRQMTEIDRRVTIAEQSAKSAHKRLDRLEGKDAND